MEPSDLTEQQRAALLKLGESASGHDFMDAVVLEELLALELVYWRREDELDFTRSGEAAFSKLAGGG